MLLGVAIILLFGLIADWLVIKLRLPGLIGLLFLGIIIGPFGINILPDELLNVSYELRVFALIVILLRAGFELSREALSKVGLRAILLSFIPCIMEVSFITFTAPFLFSISYLEAAMLGSVLAAVSPAVVVPLMIKMIEEGRGIAKGIPTLVLAGASVDDAVAIVLCSSFIGMYVGKSVHLGQSLINIPISVIIGILTGLLIGLVLYYIFTKSNPRATKRILVIFSIAIFLVILQKKIDSFIPFAALIAVMSIGFVILEKSEHMAHEISAKLGKIWIFAQLLLFTLVGAQVKVPVAIDAGFRGLLIILIGLSGRSIGVILCLIRSKLNIKERIFVILSYLPKATVQAAIGGAPLAAMAAAKMPTNSGELILAVAVLSILITAPIGAVLINIAGKRFLIQEPIDIIAPAQIAALESK
jgi:NhaP-type Na+/H+ or K+/H+ antiporter